jgi:hypothetical protein
MRTPEYGPTSLLEDIAIMQSDEMEMPTELGN